MNRIKDLLPVETHFACVKCLGIFPNEDFGEALDHDEVLCTQCADRMMAEAEDQIGRSYE